VKGDIMKIRNHLSSHMRIFYS